MTPFEQQVVAGSLVATLSIIGLLIAYIWKTRNEKGKSEMAEAVEALDRRMSEGFAHMQEEIHKIRDDQNHQERKITKHDILVSQSIETMQRVDQTLVVLNATLHGVLIKQAVQEADIANLKRRSDDLA